MLISKNCTYGVRLIKKKEASANVNEEFQDIADFCTAHVSFNLDVPETICNYDKGTIDVDFNPGETGLTEVNDESNPLYWKTVSHTELSYSSHFKGQHKIGEVVQEILSFAQAKKKDWPLKI